MVVEIMTLEFNGQDNQHDQHANNAHARSSTQTPHQWSSMILQIHPLHQRLLLVHILLLPKRDFVVVAVVGILAHAAHADIAGLLRVQWARRLNLCTSKLETSWRIKISVGVAIEAGVLAVNIEFLRARSAF